MVTTLEGGRERETVCFGRREIVCDLVNERICNAPIFTYPVKIYLGKMQEFEIMDFL